jgi:hypothetical protein
MPEDKDKMKKAERVEVYVSDKDREALKYDSFTRNNFKEWAPHIYASGWRPSITGNEVVYTSQSEKFNMPDGTRIAIRPDGNGAFDIVKMGQDGTYAQMDDQSGEYSRRSPKDIMDFLNKFYTFRYNQLADQYNQGVAKAE